MNRQFKVFAENSLIGGIQIKVVIAIFLKFLVSKDNICKSKMCSQWRITFSI